MPSSPQRIAANQANSLKSTGPKSPQGKEISRANAVKHGLSSLVVVPGEEAGLVAAHIAELQDSVASEGDPLSLILARQVAFLSIQGERAFRYLTAMAADRARNAEADYDEQRKANADQLFGYLGAEPLTNHRRLMATAEGVDVLIGHLEDLGRVGKPGGAGWEDGHAIRLDFATGHYPGMTPISRAQALSDIIVYNRTTGLDATEVPTTDRAGQVAWAIAELHKLIAAAIDRLRAHKVTLDPDRHAVSKSQAPDRAILSFDKESQLAHRYQFAAVRLMQRSADQLTARRLELARAVGPAELAEARIEAAAEADLPPMPPGMASFCEVLERPTPAADASTFTIGKPPVTPTVAPKTNPKPPPAHPLNRPNPSTPTHLTLPDPIGPAPGAHRLARRLAPLRQHFRRMPDRRPVGEPRMMGEDASRFDRPHGLARTTMTPNPARLVDSFGRVHTNLRVSVTDRCNIRCTYCMPEAVTFLPRAHLLAFEEIARLVAVAAGQGVTKVRLTGGEPLVRRDLDRLVAAIAAIPGIADLGLTTNGILLVDQARALHAAGLRRLNISLDTLDPARFRALTRRDGLDRVIAGIDAARDAGFGPIKLNALAIRGETEAELIPLARFARERGVEIRFIEYMPLDAGAWERDKVLLADDMIATLEAELGPLVPAEGRDPRSPSLDFAYADGGGRVGFIASISRPFCGNCNRLRLTADGKLRNCLFALDETDLKGLMRDERADDAALARAIRASVAGKWAGHEINSAQFIQPDRLMHAIGG